MAIGIFENCETTLQNLIINDATIIRESGTQIDRLKSIYGIVNQIMKGIAFLHENELIHSHLTPGNVLVR